MLSLDYADELAARESGLAVVITRRPDGSPAASVVNASVLDHPVTRKPAVGFVARGAVRKLTNLRAQPLCTVVFRSGWDWVAVEGQADLVGPDDHLKGVSANEVPRLLRQIYAAAVGGTPEEWTNLDTVMATERHTAVLVRPVRVYSNPV